MTALKQIGIWPVANSNRVEIYEREDGWLGWKIVSTREGQEDNIIAVDGGQKYDNEKALLTDLFSVFFGVYDETFLAAHKLWADEKTATGEEAPQVYGRQARRRAKPVEG